MQRKRYEGSFICRDGVAVTCSIWQEHSTAYTVQDLDFPADSPLVIEWPETPKYGVICPSTATLRLISPSDRKYLDLYTIRPGQIRLEVWRSGLLYWMGYLDPENASEPYTTDKNYDVTLTFSDFGILKRTPYSLTGPQTVGAVLSAALAACGGLTQETHISTRLPGVAGALSLSDLSVDSQNFYDEEGKAVTLWDTVEGVLQPLALRLVQKGGKAVVYDLQYASGQSGSVISWQSSDQVISVDKVYNNVRVCFSPYGGKDFLKDAAFEYTGEHDASIVNLTNDDPTQRTPDPLSVECYSYYPTYERTSPPDYTNIDFTMFLNPTARGIAAKHASAKFFHTEPVLGGQEHEGVALWFFTGGHGPIGGRPRYPVRKCAQSCPAETDVVMVTNRVYFPPMSATDAAKYWVRIALPLLVDARYNPFVEKGQYNEQNNQRTLETAVTMTIPITVELFPSASSATPSGHYSNKTTRELHSGAIRTADTTKGEWVSGAAAEDDCQLHYVGDWDDTSHTACEGFLTNRQAFNFVVDRPSASLKALDPGQYIPYPAQGGWMEVKVKAGIRFFTWQMLYNQWGINPPVYTGGSTLASLDNYLIRWALFGAPSITLLNAGLKTSDLTEEDVEYSGKVVTDAQEELTISTICGTLPSASPTARGLYTDQNGVPVVQLTRGTRTARIEDLLIGTMFSQYADRKDVLSGTMAIPSNGTFCVLSDASLPGKILLPLSEARDVIACEAEVSAAEVVADSYTESSE